MEETKLKEEEAKLCEGQYLHEHFKAKDSQHRNKLTKTSVSSNQQELLLSYNQEDSILMSQSRLTESLLLEQQKAPHQSLLDGKTVRAIGIDSHKSQASSENGKKVPLAQNQQRYSTPVKCKKR